MHGAPQSLDRILDGTVPDGANDSSARGGELQADGGGQSKSQDAIRNGIERARLIQREVALEIAFGRRTFFADDGISRHYAVQDAEQITWCDGMFGFRRRRFRPRRASLAFSRFGVRANVFCGGGKISDDAGSGERGGSVQRRVCDLKKIRSRLDGIAGHIGVVEKNGRAQDYNRVVTRELIGKRLLRGQQTSAK